MISQSFDWSDEDGLNMFVAIEGVSSMDIDECFREALKNGKTIIYTQLVRSIEMLANVRNRKAKQEIKLAIDNGLVCKFQEDTDSNSKRVWYKLSPGNE